MRHTLLSLAFSTVALAAPSPAAPAAPRVVLGTQQLDGQNARPGQTFTIGKQSPLNFTLRSAEYRVGRVVIGTSVLFPAANEKLLVLHYTVHNPQKRELRYYWADVRFTALDLQDRPHDFVQAVVRDGTAEPLEVRLKPAEKVDVLTVIRVPAQGIIPKLIVQRDGDPQVLRYDLHGQVQGLAAPFADPADPSGASALAQPRLPAGTLASLSGFDVRLDDARFTSEPLHGRAPATDHRYLVATFTLKNPLASEARYAWSSLTPSLKDAGGEWTAYNGVMLKGARDEVASGTLPAGQEVRVRYYFELPAGVAADTVSLIDGSGRGFTFDVSSTR